MHYLSAVGSARTVSFRQPWPRCGLRYLHPVCGGVHFHVADVGGGALPRGNSQSFDGRRRTDECEKKDDMVYRIWPSRCDRS